MRKLGGFFISYGFSLWRHSIWGGIALLLFLLRFWIKAIPLLLPLAFLGVWLLVALIFISFLGLATKAGGRPGPPMENKNPYSAKNEDLFPGPQEGGTLTADDYWMGFLYVPHDREEAETFTVDEWMANIRCLWEAVFLLGVPFELFLELANRAQNADLSPWERIITFLDNLFAEGYLFLDEAPDRDGCRKFRITMNCDTCYYGTIPVEHAEAFETKLRYYFSRMGCEQVHRIYFLGENA